MAFDDLSTDALRAESVKHRGTDRGRALLSELADRDNAAVVLFNAVLAGQGPALERAGVPAATIREAEDAVAREKARREAEKRDPARIAMIQRDAEGDTTGAVYVPPTGGA